jgi:uncharacterized protein (TIGR02145 family)
MKLFSTNNITVSLLVTLLVLAACEEKSESKTCSDSFTDSRDGKKYCTVKIGEQVWMAENLNYKPSSGNSWCYDNKESNCNKYGRLYDLYDGYIPKKVCPSGWHLPTVEEWDALMNFAGGYEVAEKKLKAKSGWDNGNGTDDFGFSALPGGHRLQLPGNGGFWWQEDNSNDGKPNNVMVIGKDECNIDDCLDNSNGFSIRCVQGVVEEVAAADAKSKIPAGYQLYIPDGSIVGDIPGEVHGDLNGDGLEDCVLLIRSTDKSMIDNDDPHAPNKNPLGIMIFFNTGNGYRLVFENRDGIPPPEYDSQMMHDYSVEIKNGKLYISERGRYGGEKYTFRYKNSEFELIGFDSYTERFVSHITEKEVSINFLTKKRLTKINVNEDSENEEQAVFKETWDVIKMDNPPKLLKSGGFVKMNVD